MLFVINQTRPERLVKRLCLGRSKPMVCHPTLPTVVRGGSLWPKVDVGIHNYLHVAESADFPRATRAGLPQPPYCPPAPHTHTTPLLWRSAVRSPSQAAGTAGRRVSPPRSARGGSTGPFWRWRHLLGEQLLSVEWFLIKKKKVTISHTTKRIGIHPLMNRSVVWF